MRYELTDREWAAIRPMLPNKPRGVPRVNDRRVLNGIFWVLRSGAPWRDLPQGFGPYTTCTTCYNRFIRCGVGLASGARSWKHSQVLMMGTSK
jgi:transposase